jgi:hypothetical protein
MTISARRSALVRLQKGFGLRYPNPTVSLGLPTNAFAQGIAFTNAMDAVIVAFDTFPYLAAYRWGFSGFGARFPNPMAFPPAGQQRRLVLSPSESVILMGHENPPYVSAYEWTPAGFGNKYPNPAVLPSVVPGGISNLVGAADVKFAPDESAVFVSYSDFPYITAYRWSQFGFGARFDNPSIPLPGRVLGIAINQAQDVIILAHDNAPYISAYEWSSLGFGAKFPDPDPLPRVGDNNNANAPGGGRRVTFNPDETVVAFTHTSDNTVTGLNFPSVTAIEWSPAGFGNLYPEPAEVINVNGQAIAFSPTGRSIAVGSNNQPSLAVYEWTPAGFGNLYPSAVPNIPGNARTVVFSPSGNVIGVVHPATSPLPGISVYRWRD